jgi:hypothetical protein
MASPLEHYTEIDLGARKDDDLNRSPEKYFWGALNLAIFLLFVGGIFFPSLRIAQPVMLIAFLGIAATTIIRSFRKAR